MRITAMLSPPVSSVILSLLALASTAVASDAESTSTTTACTASSTSGAFFDLRPDAAIKPKPDGSRPSHSRGAPLTDYKARGWDYGSNFTLNICNAVVEPIEDVKDIAASKWQNISAYYVSEGEYYSLGFQSGSLVTRGKELVLQYTGGSPCGTKRKSTSRSLSDRSTIHSGAAYRNYENEEDEPSSSTPEDSNDGDSNKDDEKDGKEDGSKVDDDKGDDDNEDDEVRRKSTTIFFACDRDVVGGNAAVSFIAVDPEECNYVFKVKSAHACATAEPHKPGSVGPGSVFAIILVVAVFVYLLGGVFYNRTVGNARGWRQLPNHAMWQGIWSFICDIFVIATSSCARLLPSRRGYHYLSGSSSSRARNNRDAENRLIDQYDEEWED
ncbi:mannose-6-phosphate receptor binding domain-containing protein [Xylaria bambusicola]|uniref:mannose-6-phosphate receptor binding domain-containing protein n=1 Tax=Xylaria bambusicola TaxID=326684 RepID=UPI00200805DF|nr:mannose-6-phosphate receptor binding domain-containing protein [Xylaria bambusicola]KAI0527942.1 mannose-6-phosphate receptor binding domain-containing protein [Xylaria bambusicola]